MRVALACIWVLSACAPRSVVHTHVHTATAAAAAPEVVPRSARVHVPADYDPAVAYPLVLLLHGYGTTGTVEDEYFDLSSRVTSAGFVLLIPEGSRDTRGFQYWNAGPACCDLDDAHVDDVAYLTGLVDETMASHHIDPLRVYVIGHSNGGFMAYELACKAPERFVAVVSLAGSGPPTEADCPSSEHRVSVLQIHGTADRVILYEGRERPASFIRAPYPSAPETTRRFAARLACATAAELPPFDFDRGLEGEETRVLDYVGCEGDTHATLWTIDGGGHVPRLSSEATERVLAWLLSRVRQSP